MDGVVGLEGDGPGAQGDPKKAGFILAGQDSVALDAVATTLIGMDPLSVPILKRAADRKMWTGNVKDIIVLGETIEELKVSFKQPSGNRGMMNTVMSNGILRRIFLKAAVPYPVADKKCVRCGICKQNCPAGAITITDKARMDYSKCIRCYCCHELCPHKAIRLKRLL
jgi:ferredoxin